MSNKIYCPNCYSASESTVKLSKCPKCGKSYLENDIVATKSVSVVKIKPSLKKVIEQDLEDDGYDENYVAPEIDKIEFEIPKNLRANREHINSVAAKGQLGIARRPRNAKGKQLSKKQIEKQWAEKFPQNSRQNPNEVGE